MIQVHLFQEEFAALQKVLLQEPSFHAIVLDCGVAGMVKYYILNDVLYYEDYLYTNTEHLMSKFPGNEFQLHSEIYQKLALINAFYDA